MAILMSSQSIILKIEQGKPANPRTLDKFLLSLEDGTYELDASRINKRSNGQNKYLHGLLIPEFRKALNSVGYDEVKTDVQAKLILKSLFLTDEIFSKDNGEVIKYVKDTSSLSKEEMTILIDDVIKFAAENMNYQIAYPSEQLILGYE